MKLHNWKNKVHVTMYMEREHLEALDRLADQTGEARQWILRTILEKALQTVKIRKTEVTL